MDQFENVTVVKAANIYFEGKVSSRTVNFADGSRKTLGIMLPGDYKFGTAEKEIMEILAGQMKVKLPGEDWKAIRGGETFEVPADASFELQIIEAVDYCCSYIA